MAEKSDPLFCERCSVEAVGNHCSNCGIRLVLPRIDRKYIQNEIGKVLYLDRGFFYTLRELVLGLERQ